VRHLLIYLIVEHGLFANSDTNIYRVSQNKIHQHENHDICVV